MYDTTFAKANDDYRREVLTRSWTHHRSQLHPTTFSSPAPLRRATPRGPRLFRILLGK